MVNGIKNYVFVLEHVLYAVYVIKNIKNHNDQVNERKRINTQTIFMIQILMNTN